MNTTEQFIAYAKRDARIIEEIRQTRFILQLVNVADITVEGNSLRLVLTREIERLRSIMRMMGGADDYGATDWD